MASPTAIKRLTQDYRRLKKDPVPYIEAAPLESNILEWRYCVKGPEDTPYYGGYYHGRLLFPPDYPFKPPRITMITPNGRFATNKRLCLSISDFHPDTWNPAWSVATILTGLLSFMVESSPTVGSIRTSDQEKKRLAINSWSFNLDDKIFNKMFPDLIAEIKEKIEKMNREEEERKQRLEQYNNTHSRRGDGNEVTGEGNTEGRQDDVLQEHNQIYSTCISLLWNIAPFVLFASFMYIVQLIINSS